MSSMASGDSEGLVPEYDFSRGVRGKYARRFADGSNVVFLEPDVAQVFTSSEDVNAALRALIELLRTQAGRVR
jgi:hypothetical protein